MSETEAMEWQDAVNQELRDAESCWIQYDTIILFSELESLFELRSSLDARIQRCKDAIVKAAKDEAAEGAQ